MDLKNLYARIRDWWTTLDEPSRNQYLKAYAVRFAYNSARIEDSTISLTTTREIFSTGKVKSFSGNVRTLYEIQDQKDAFAKVVGDVDRARPFDESLVLEAHQTLTWGTYSSRQLADGERPGTYKVGDYLITGAPEVGASAEETPGLVRDLCGEITEALGSLTPKKALVVASYFHTSFESIHPFADGSGLTGRLLMNYILLAGGHPPVVVYDEDKDAYFEALESFNSEGNLEPFKKFLMAETIKTWRESASLSNA